MSDAVAVAVRRGHEGATVAAHERKEGGQGEDAHITGTRGARLGVRHHTVSKASS